MTIAYRKNIVLIYHFIHDTLIHMHPLSFFPDLLSFGLIGPTLLRLAVACIGLSILKTRYSKPAGWVVFPLGIVSVLIFLGLYTQISALIGIVLLAFEFKMEQKPIDSARKTLYILIGIIVFTLLFTGPGFLGLDLPL
jgi:hypothetical protein